MLEVGGSRPSPPTTGCSDDGSAIIGAIRPVRLVDQDAGLSSRRSRVRIPYGLLLISRRGTLVSQPPFTRRGAMTCFRLILIKDEIKVAVRAIRLDLQSLLEEWVGLVAGRVRKQVKLGEEGAAVWSLNHDVDVLPILA